MSKRYHWDDDKTELQCWADGIWGCQTEQEVLQHLEGMQAEISGWIKDLKDSSPLVQKNGHTKVSDE